MLLFSVTFILSAAFIPAEIGVVGDACFAGIVRQLQSQTMLPWCWRPLSQGSAEDYRLVICHSRPGKPLGWVLGRVPLLPVVHRWNPVEIISAEEFKGVKSGDIKRWDQLGGEACPIITAAGKNAIPRLLNDRRCLGWVYWPQLTPKFKVLEVQGRSFPWRGGPDATTEFGWAILEPPARRGNFDLRGMIRDLAIGRALRRKFHERRWLYGEQRAVMSAVGDLLFDRGITKTAWKKYGDYAYVFGLTVHRLRSADLLVGNLECPLNRTGKPINLFTGDTKAIPAIRYGGFDLLSLANNHVLDCGTRGLLETMAELEKNGVRVVGAGVNRDEARRARIVNIRGIRIAVLAYTEVRLGFTYARVPLEWRAGTDRPGVNFFELSAIREDLARARRMADIVVVLAHWGDEYQSVPNSFQRRMARLMLAEGADLVIGSHPHVIQGITFGGRGLVAYSLGNFVFDQSRLACREGLILEALLDQNRVLQVGLRPVVIEEGRPQPVEGEAAKKIVGRLEKLSKGLDHDRKEERGDAHETD
jgi:poly-gamma-glutamate capsule biosynthesis protein CapA/YwtB (metallophosphatase superfamily)